MSRHFLAALATSALVSAAVFCSAAAPPPGTPAARLAAAEAQYPPWQNGENDDATRQGLVFTVPPVDDMADFHGSLDDPALVLYASGNYFFAMAGIVRAFGEAYPSYRGRIFYETLPPGLLLKQMEGGGTITSGNLTFTAKPDVMMAEQRASEAWVKDGRLAGPVVSFATNDLTIMVPADNPAHITSLADLARPDLALVMPNPEFEGVARQIRASLVKAGGEALAQAVYDTKVAAGMTVLTRIHHRQNSAAAYAGIRSSRGHLAVRGHLPREPGPSHRPRRHSSGIQRAGDLQRRDGPRRRPRGGGPSAGCPSFVQTPHSPPWPHLGSSA